MPLEEFQGPSAALTRSVSRLNPFQKQRDLSERFDMSSPNPKLGSIYTKDANREPSPIISLSVGSAGMHRTALWTKKMNALGCLGRIQSLIVYDCNTAKLLPDQAQGLGQRRPGMVHLHVHAG